MRSGFLSFGTPRERDAFLADLDARIPALRAHCLPSRFGARVIVRDVSSDDRTRRRERGSNRGAGFDDVTFTVPDLVPEAPNRGSLS